MYSTSLSVASLMFMSVVDRFMRAESRDVLNWSWSLGYPARWRPEYHSIATYLAVADPVGEGKLEALDFEASQFTKVLERPPAAGRTLRARNHAGMVL